MPQRTSPATILFRFFLFSFLIALFPYGILFVAVGAISLPFLAAVALLATLIVNGLQWLGHRAFGSICFGDDPAYQRFRQSGGDPWFHMNCPWPLNTDSERVRMTGSSQQWQCGQCGSPVDGELAPCSSCGNQPPQP